MPPTRKITVATSIPPTLRRWDGDRPCGEEYQQRCIESWIDAGFRVLSLNSRAEIEHLAERFPQVTFVETRRNAEKLLGRKAPYIADLLTALAAERDSVVGIINSDLLFEPGFDWQRILRDATKRSVVIGQRHDVVSLTGSIPEKFYWGFDFFFFERKAIPGILSDAMPLAMGVPWWDYWLPIALAFHGRAIKLLARPRVIHLDHGRGYSRSLSHKIGGWFAAYVARMAQRGYKPRRLAALVEACRKAMRDTAIDGVDAENPFGEVATICVTELRARTIEPRRRTADRRMRPPAPKPGSARAAFMSFDRRVKAGGRRTEALTLLSKDRLNEAAKIYRALIEQVPDDIDTLSGYGALLTRQGRFQDSLPVFERAAALRPDVCLSQTLLGNALAALDRPDDAFACFERATAVDPDFADRGHLALAHYNLGRMLHVRARAEDALAQYEKALSYRREFAPAVEQHYLLRRFLRAGAKDQGGNRDPQYFSRQGEDALLDIFFRHKKTGFFVDVDELDGIVLSNSYAFERQGWHGLCVIPALPLFRLCVQNRPRTRCVLADCSTGPERKSPKAATASARDRRKKSRDVDAEEVPSIPLDKILAGPVRKIDFATIRSTGDLRTILKGLDLARRRPRVLLIHANPTQVRSLEEFLSRHGYRSARRMKWSRLYVQNKKDARRLRSIAVSAKIELTPDRIALAPKLGISPSSYFYWPAER